MSDYRGAPRRSASPEEAKALAHPLRLRILRLCLDEPRTNRELAGALGRDPGSVLHHVRVLVDQDFLRADTPRTGKRGSREKPYLATRKSWILDFTEGAEQRKLPAVVEATIEEMQETPAADFLEASRLGLRLSAGDVDALRARLGELALAVGDLPEDPGGQRVALFIALHRRP